MRVLSLFDGMGGAIQALKENGVKIEKYYASEIDKFAIKIAKKNHPEIIHLGDVTKITSEMVGEIDLLIGGSPCQGFSFAGKQLNFEDERSVLFFEYVRILKELKPKYFLLENVMMKKQYEDVISEHVGVEPIMINSSIITAQNRKRLYWTNILEKPYTFFRGQSSIKKPAKKTVVLTDIIQNGVCGFVRNHEKITRRHDNKSTCIAANYFRGIDNRGARTGVIMADGKTRMLSPIECERLQGFPDGYTDGVSKCQRYKMLGNGFTVPIISYILSHIGGQG